MNFYKALFLCLLLSSAVSVDRSLQTSNGESFNVSKACVEPAASLLGSRPQAVDETASYAQAHISSLLSPGYRPG
jgi:hypothetical protein